MYVVIQGVQQAIDTVHIWGWCRIERKGCTRGGLRRSMWNLNPNCSIIRSQALSLSTSARVTAVEPPASHTSRARRRPPPDGRFYRRCHALDRDRHRRRRETRDFFSSFIFLARDRPLLPPRDHKTMPILLTAARLCSPETGINDSGGRRRLHRRPSISKPWFSPSAREKSALCPTIRCHRASHQDWVREHQGNQPSGRRDNDCFCPRLRLAGGYAAGDCFSYRLSVFCFLFWFYAGEWWRWTKKMKM